MTSGTSEEEFLIGISGDSGHHIRMQRSGPHKYRTKDEPVTPLLARRHLEGTLCLGADMLIGGHSTRALCYESDTEVDSALLMEVIGPRLALSGARAFWETSPSEHHPGGGHMWLIFEDPVPAADAHATILSHAPELHRFEHWPSGGCVRLPCGFHQRGNVAAWCGVSMFDPDTGQLSEPRMGIQAIRLMMEWNTPSSWVTETALTPEVSATKEVRTVDLTSLNSLDGTPVPPDYARTVPTAMEDSKWHARYGDKPGVLFAITPKQAIALFNGEHKVVDLLPPERSGHGLAHWRGERIASVMLYPEKNTWADFGQHEPKANGKHDGGDAFELACRVSGRSKSEVLAPLVDELNRRARSELERAAAEGRGPARWVAEITTPGGWRWYDKLRKRSS